MIPSPRWRFLTLLISLITVPLATILIAGALWVGQILRDSWQLTYADYQQPGGLYTLHVKDVHSGVHYVLMAEIASANPPQPSPDKRYFLTRTITGRVQVVDRDGNTIHQIYGAGLPSWSPDSTQVAYYVYDQLYTKHIGDAYSEVQINHENIITTLSSPSWSPDSERIAFIVAERYNTEAYTVRADGSQLTLLTPTLNDVRSVPVWSPDGTRLVFEAWSGDNIDLYVVNADGSNLRQLTRRSDDDFNPVWSPDSEHILFISDDQASYGRYTIYAIESHIENPPVVTLIDSLPQPSNILFSPDGEQIALVSDNLRQIYTVEIWKPSRSLQPLTRANGNYRELIRSSTP